MEKVRYMWNGIKVDGQLYKVWYSFSIHSYQNDNDPHITMYSTSYANRFPEEVHELFTVKNDTDSMTDYFDKDRIRLDRHHPEWERVAEAYIKQEIHQVKMHTRRGLAPDKQEADIETFKTNYAKQLKVAS